MKNKNKKAHAPRNVGNRDLAVAMVEKRRSNAAVKHADRRTKRLRTRATALRAAVGEW